MDSERLRTENEILRAEYARADNERLRLVEEVTALRVERDQLLSGSEIPDLRKQVTEARRIIKAMVHRVIAPMRKWRRCEALIKGNEKMLDEAVVQIYMLDEPNGSAN